MSKLTYKQSLDLIRNYNRTYPKRHVFPIRAGAKFPPCVKDNLDTNASNDPAKLEKWCRAFPGCNWGVAHKKSGLFVVDVDVAKGGQATYDDLDLQYGFPPAEMTRTPSGGFHLIYEGKHIMALGQFGFGQGVDSPNYTIIAGSRTSKGDYVAEGNAPTAKAPQWFYDFLAKVKKDRNEVAGEEAIELDKPENVAWAKLFLDEDAEPAIEGKSGDMQTVKIAMGVRDKGISQALCFELMRDIYNPRCEPPWELEDLEKKVENAYRYANQSRVGDRTAEADFEGDDFKDEDIQTEGTPEEIARDRKTRETAKRREETRESGPRTFLTKKDIIADYAYIGTHFDVFISKENPDLTWKAASFDRSFKYVQPKGKLSEELLKQKTGSIERYNGLMYQPGAGAEVNGFLNLYRPSGMIPIKGDTSLFDAHLEYLFPETEDRNIARNWCAWFVQNIEKKPKHALLIQGATQGTGKSYIAEVMRRIVGERNTRALTQSDLTSDYNGWAMHSKLITIEEIRAGDKRKVSEKLHDLITQETVSVNEKNIKRFDTRNCFGFLATSNKDDATILDDTDRRFAIVRTVATPQGPEYYAALYASLNRPEVISAIAYQLMNWDLAGYDGAGPAPITQAKLEMIEQTADEIEHWMLNSGMGLLSDGRIVRIDDIRDEMPRHLQTRAPDKKIASILKRKFKGIKLGQVRLGGRLSDRPTLWAINGFDASELKESQLAAIYNEDRIGIIQPDDFGDHDESDEQPRLPPHNEPAEAQPWD